MPTTTTMTTPRLSILQKHPLAVEFEPMWQQLSDAYFGAGGFQDGTYLRAHPREYLDHDAAEPRIPSKKLKARRLLARYENLARMIIDSKQAALFRQQPVRRVSPTGTRTEARQPTVLEQWWTNVDGNGCHVDDFMAEAWASAAVFGWTVLVMDRETTSGLPYVCKYDPPSVSDWLDDGRGALLSLKLLEPKPRTTFDGRWPTKDWYRVRVLDATTWSLYEADGSRIDEGAHAFGRLPAVVLYSRRLSRDSVMGQSVLHDPKLFIDLYNLTSELRELLRNQTFGILNVPLGTGQDAATVETARTMIGQTVGTDQVMFSPVEAKYVSPDPANVAAYQSERADLVRTIYRLCNVPWESDSKDAEAEGSLQLKREDMNTILAAYADFCEKAEYELADLVYRAADGALVGAHKVTSDQVVIKYPDTFDVQPVRARLEEAQAAIALDFPPEVTAELQRRHLDVILPDLAPEKKKDLEAAIEAHSKQSDPAERARRRVQASFDEIRKQERRPPAPEQ